MAYVLCVLHLPLSPGHEYNTRPVEGERNEGLECRIGYEWVVLLTTTV